MAKTLRGCPAPGLIVRDPAHDFQPVPATVADYPANDYWRRRFAQGDMIAETAQAPAAEAPVAKVPAAKEPADATGSAVTDASNSRRTS